jgi:hypothetical protein
VSRIEQLLETLEDVRREFSLLRHLDPNGEARALRDLLEDELYGANSGGRNSSRTEFRLSRQSPVSSNGRRSRRCALPITRLRGWCEEWRRRGGG